MYVELSCLLKCVHAFVYQLEIWLVDKEKTELLTRVPACACISTSLERLWRIYFTASALLPIFSPEQRCTWQTRALLQVVRYTLHVAL